MTNTLPTSAEFQNLLVNAAVISAGGQEALAHICRVTQPTISRWAASTTEMSVTDMITCVKRLQRTGHIGDEFEALVKTLWQIADNS